MAAPLAPLRRDLDLMPSPVADRPGLLLRDPLGYAQVVLIIPPPLVPGLTCFDGRHTELDLRELLVQVTGQIEVGGALRHLVTTLASSGFLEDEAFARLRADRTQAFARAPRRDAAHAGSAYPAEVQALTAMLVRYMDGSSPGERPPPDGGLVAIAAPHVSPEGGWRSYRAAYRCLGPDLRKRTCVILGTSHYGAPGRFGLTRKTFVTPLGEASLDRRLVDELAERGGAAVEMEDYCHAVEHSIEFQVVFLQNAFGSDVRILPILCGPLLGEQPEADVDVRRFLETLADVTAREGDRLLFVLGVDMAHVGRRYGDLFDAVAFEGRMTEVAEQDALRLERIEAGDADGFWDLVQDGGHDDLKWCGASPIYTFLRTAGPVRGRRIHYDQWNIDEQSVVSFAGLSFIRASRTRKADS